MVLGRRHEQPGVLVEPVRVQALLCRYLFGCGQHLLFGCGQHLVLRVLDPGIDVTCCPRPSVSDDHRASADDVELAPNPACGQSGRESGRYIRSSHPLKSPRDGDGDGGLRHVGRHGDGGRGLHGRGRGTLTFAAWETSKTVSMPIIDDEKDDDGETLTLSDASGAAIADAAATGTIGDAEPALPGQSVSDVETSEEDDAALSFAVTLDPAATGRVTVDYATADGTATAGSDYTTTKRDADLRGGGEVEDGVGADHRRLAGRRRGDVDAQAEQGPAPGCVSADERRRIGGYAADGLDELASSQDQGLLRGCAGRAARQIVLPC